MPVYNGEKYLAEAIDSILGQSFMDFEFIVVNDGSTDATASLLADYTDPRLKVVHNDGNKGVSYSLNRGLDLAKGKYIARMDADDIALPHRLQVQYDFMESHPDVGICGSDIEVFGGGIAGRKREYFPVSDLEIRARVFTQLPFAHPTVMICKDILDRFHLRYPSFKVEDYALWVELLKHTKGWNIPQVLLYYRICKLSATAQFNVIPEVFYKDILTIQSTQFAEYAFFVDAEAGFIYACFTNSPSPLCPLRADEQVILGETIVALLKAVSEHDKSLSLALRTALSKLCFYRFFKLHKIPSNRVLRKLYIKGFWNYYKQSLTHKYS
ncbi:hypothetical protein AGMMS49525_11880 [Bacteroidia bacterium]|nr:hypothetical protein AGMMS49525_11880 [Bacteroidia bacterium]